MATEVHVWIGAGAASSNWLKDLAPIIAALITGGITAATALLIYRVSHRQANTAADKLAVDLFDKRFKAFEGLQTALGEWVEDAWLRYNNRTDRSIRHDVIQAWVSAESDVHWLFGEDVFQQARKVGNFLVALGHIDLDEDDEGEPQERQNRFEKEFARSTYEEFAKFRNMVEPYMMLDKIAVNRPSKGS
jgi:hypothetical protein